MPPRWENKKGRKEGREGGERKEGTKEGREGGKKGEEEAKREEII